MTNAIQKHRSNFAKRLIEALAHTGLDDSPTTLARYFNLHSDGDVISMHGARRWLLGESIPTQAHLHALAKMLGVSSAWLLLGQGAMLELTDTSTDHRTSERDFLLAYQSLSGPEREVVCNLMRMLLRGVRRTA